jgi:hypothetical protein
MFLLFIIMIFVLATSIFAVLYFTKPCSCPVFTKQASPKQESPCPEQSKYKDLDCKIYNKDISQISLEEMQKCAKITSENDCIKNNLCYWGSKGERIEMTTGDTPEEIKNKYSKDIYEKSCMVGEDGYMEIMWKHAMCTKDSNSDKKMDLNEFKNDPDISKSSQKGIDLITKIFNEVKGSDNKINRCQYNKFNKKLVNEMTKMMEECKKLNKNFNSASYKCIDKPEEPKRKS